MRRVEVLNKEEITGCGEKQLRSDAVDIVEAAIQAADPYGATKRIARMEDASLCIDSLQYDLRSWDHIYVLGAGKATHDIALAMEEVLGDRITDGVVVLKHGDRNLLNRIRVIYGGHPIPDQGSLDGGRELMELASRAGERDLVIAAITGGSSALAILPPEGISLSDVQYVFQLLLNCGASIFEINAVRKHLSRIKGGRLAQQIFPAELVSLTVSDVIGDALDYITDLTVPDTSSYMDAWNALDKYQLWDKLPFPVRNHLQKGSEIESPKSLQGRYHTFLLVTGDAAFQGAIKRCQELGYLTQFVDRAIDGESTSEARHFVSLALQKRPMEQQGQKYALVANGETIVTIDGQHGSGGPNQEFALSAALAIVNYPGVVVAAIDLDGTDGPTNTAGAIVDGKTVDRAKAEGFNAVDYLSSHSSGELLLASNDLIYTGHTGTNVNDIMFVLVLY